MPHAVMPLPFKPHRLCGLSDRLLESHYENDYGGAVRRLNTIEERLAAIDRSSAPMFELDGLKREELAAATSVILHEIYFDGLGEPGDDPAGDLAQALERDFGSVARWRAEFAAVGKAHAGGSGWVLLTRSDRDDRLRNRWATDHAHDLSGGTPVLALDMHEHAYHLDFGTRAGDYVDAFMRNIRWDRVGARYERARGRCADASPPIGPRQVAAEELRDRLGRGERLLVLDVRLRDDLARRPDRIPGTDWRDPERVQAWAGELPHDVPIVLYCMYGFWVSQDSADALRERGLDACSLAGGIAAWRAIGAPVSPPTDS